MPPNMPIPQTNGAIFSISVILDFKINPRILKISMNYQKKSIAKLNQGAGDSGIQGINIMRDQVSLRIKISS